ncbi:MAG: hypothetical protein GTO22_00865 [Gemmatimonadales bacterium]|nr:hypothetical protein [Gemmatimonadales bacterium]
MASGNGKTDADAKKSKREDFDFAGLIREDNDGFPRARGGIEGLGYGKEPFSFDRRDWRYEDWGYGQGGGGKPINKKKGIKRAKWQVTFPPMGWDFPRNYVEILPDESLFDPTRLLGTRVAGGMAPTGKTGLHTPRVESPEYKMVAETNDCPPASQLPYIKRQIHLDLSRDSESIYCTNTLDVPAGGSAIVLAFDTFINLRTFIRWVDVQVFDALEPPEIGTQIRVDCTPVKFIACPQSIQTEASGLAICSFPQGTISSPGSLDYTKLPKDFHNVLMEITDKHHVDFLVTNTSVADRKVCISVWGWIESVTAWDNTVKR